MALTTKKQEIDWFPLKKTLKGYNLQKAKADLKAGLNVALLDFPQGMAYAMIAGFPVQFGIYSSAISSITGPLFASSRFLMLGPTNATSVLLLSSFLTLNVPDEQKLLVLPLLVLMVGVIMIVGSFLRAAFFVRYISRSVITGYITAAAVLIIVNQLKHVLGLDIPRASTFFDVLQLTMAHLTETHWPSLALGLITALVYLPLRRYSKGIPIIVIVLAVMAAVYQFFVYMGYPTRMLPTVPVGEWPLSVPTLKFETVSQLASTAMAIGFLSILQSSSIAKTLAARAGDKVDMNQQMFSMGVANLGNAFGSGMPVSGSLTRSVLNYSSGAQSPVSSIVSGLILVFGVLLCGPIIGFIPKPALAMLVITVGISLIHPAQIMVILKSTRSDAGVFLTTFFAGLFFPLDTAIYLGAGVSIMLFLNKVSKPELHEMAFNDRGELAEKQSASEPNDHPEISIVHVEGDLFFGSSDIFLDQMRALVESKEKRIIILRLRNAYHLDATSAIAIGELVTFARERGSDVIVSGAHKDVEKVFENSGLLKQIGPENFFSYTPENVTLSTRNALLRASEILGGRLKPNITIYAKVDEDKDDA